MLSHVLKVIYWLLLSFILSTINDTCGSSSSVIWIFNGMREMFILRQCSTMRLSWRNNRLAIISRGIVVDVARLYRPNGAPTTNKTGRCLIARLKLLLFNSFPRDRSMVPPSPCSSPSYVGNASDCWLPRPRLDWLEVVHHHVLIKGTLPLIVDFVPLL